MFLPIPKPDAKNVSSCRCFQQNAVTIFEPKQRFLNVFPLVWFGFVSVLVVAIAQSVEPLATSWTVRGSNPSEGEIFRTCPERPWGPPSFLYNVYRVFPGGKTAGAWRLPPTHLAPSLKKE